MNIQCREIPISDLPDCELKEQIREWVKDNASVIVVAKPGMVGDWAAYIGYPKLTMIKDEYTIHDWIVYHCTMISSKEQIVRLGNKLDPQTANELFPEWSYRRYRT